MSTAADDKQRQAIEPLVPSLPDLSLDAGVMDLFVRYLHHSGALEATQTLFGAMRKSSKGLSVAELFKQMFCFLIDPRNRFLIDFDRLKSDTRYARSISAGKTPMASSHAVKRFYRAFTWPGVFRFRYLMQQLFLWRLHIYAPNAIFFHIRPYAEEKPHRNRDKTKSKGRPAGPEVHAYTMNWGPFTIDATLRPKGIPAHDGNLYRKMLSRVADNVRMYSGQHLPLVIWADGKHLGPAPWQWLDPLKIGYLLIDRPRKCHLDYALRQSHGKWRRVANKTVDYEYLDINKPPYSWAYRGRIILFRTIKKTDQMQFAFAPPEYAIFTSIRSAEHRADSSALSGPAGMWSAPSIIDIVMARNLSNGPGATMPEDSDLRVPFMHFKPNCAYFYTRLAAQFLYASFKVDLMPQWEKVNAVQGPLNALSLAR
jgi:hypothetical protein